MFLLKQLKHLIRLLKLSFKCAFHRRRWVLQRRLLALPAAIRLQNYTNLQVSSFLFFFHKTVKAISLPLGSFFPHLKTKLANFPSPDLFGVLSPTPFLLSFFVRFFLSILSFYSLLFLLYSFFLPSSLCSDRPKFFLLTCASESI